MGRSVFSQTVVSLSNESADVPNVMNSNQKLDVSLDGTLWSHTTNLNAFVLTPAVRKRGNINFRLTFLTSGTSTFSLLKIPDDGLPRVPYSKLCRMS